MQAIVQTDYLVRPVAFEEMSALLDQALEEIRVVTEALRERREAAHCESMRLLELSTEQRAQRRKAREIFFHSHLLRSRRRGDTLCIEKIMIRRPSRNASACHTSVYGLTRYARLQSTYAEKRLAHKREHKRTY